MVAGNEFMNFNSVTHRGGSRRSGLPVRWAGVLAGLLVALALSSCSTSRSEFPSPHQLTSVHQVRDAIDAGPAKVASIASQLEVTLDHFRDLSEQNSAGWKTRGYLGAKSSERMEFLLFRFVSAQDALSDLVGSLGGKHPATLFPDENLRVAAHLLATDAQFLLIQYRAKLVALFASDEIAQKKLNEAFYRSEIPSGTFDRIELSVTGRDIASRLHASWRLLEAEKGTPRVAALTRSRPEYADLIKRLPVDYREALAALAALKDGAVSQVIDRDRAAALQREARSGLGNAAYNARSLLFRSVSRLKNPAIKIISFTDAQHAQVKGMLQPGDIILTYTAGYMSDVFIPGSFKHGITYVGSPEQRREAGLDVSRLPEAARREARAVAAKFDRAQLPNGKEADVIEAVAEGVIFNNLGYLMDTHINRMAVVRPKLSHRERAEFLAEVFSYHGDSYDFLFDFGDASRQVCTEVIWRGMNRRAGIEFSLEKRGGHPTLSADDIVNYHFKTGGKHFEFVLFAEEDFSQRGHRAVIHTGPGGEEKLRRQMADTE